MSFLKAEWKKLMMVNYEIDPQILTEDVPFGTELDTWSGRCYVSLIGFMFNETRVAGVKVPFHINFEEVNLRFYVKRHEGDEWKRGVVFIKEIVPKPAIALVANALYNENYEALKMDHRWDFNEDEGQVAYSWKKAGQWQQMSLTCTGTPEVITPGSEAEFIMEHYWGYARVNDQKSTEYEVTHPKWLHYPVTSYELNVDFEKTYGSRFGFLSNTKPTSVFLAEGSAITVEGKKIIKG